MEDEIELQEPTGLRNWMDDEQRILNIQQNPVREPMKSIRGVFIFVNQQHYIDKIVVEDIDVLRSEPPKGGLQLELRRSSETSNNEGQSPELFEEDFRNNYSENNYIGLAILFTGTYDL